jgi:hypothetical protein
VKQTFLELIHRDDAHDGDNDLACAEIDDEDEPRFKQRVQGSNDTALTRVQEILGNTTSFDLQRTGYWEDKQFLFFSLHGLQTILEKLRCVSSHASKETRELLQISHALPSSPF